jgi:hypothetical protein
MLVTPAGIESALRRTENYLLTAPIVEALIARREADAELPDDAELITVLAEELLEHQAEDGSWGGHVSRTAEGLLLLGALLPQKKKHEAAKRGVAWLRTRQNKPGRFGEPCEPDLHAAGVCHHSTSGFFSPAGPQVSLAGHTLQNGLKFVTDRDARLGISALTLRAITRWTELTEEDRKHVQALTRLLEGAFRPGRVSLLGAAASLEALYALASAPRTPELTVALHTTLSRLAHTQRADGSWAELDSFPVIDVLLHAIRSGYGSPVFDGALLRASEQLTFSQTSDGAWGTNADPYRTLTGWRALRFTSAHQAAGKKNP